MENQLISVEDNTQLELFSVGEGKDLIIQHGWSGSCEDWKPIMQSLADKYRCHAFNQRPYLTNDCKIEKMAADLNFCINNLCKEKPVILGHSMGALICWEYLRIYGQDNISGLIIVDMTPRMLKADDWDLCVYGTLDEKTNNELIQKFEDDFIAAVTDLVLSGKVMSDELKQQIMQDEYFKARMRRLESFVPEWWITAWKSITETDYRDILQTIQIPTLLLYGDKSNFYGEKVANYVADKIPNSKLHLFKGSGHSPQMEQPQLFIQVVKEFWGDLT